MVIMFSDRITDDNMIKVLTLQANQLISSDTSANNYAALLCMLVPRVFVMQQAGTETRERQNIISPCGLILVNTIIIRSKPVCESVVTSLYR